MSNLTSKELCDQLKSECNYFVNGQCTTLACLKRDAGGKRAQVPLVLVGCVEYRALKEIERLRWSLAEVKKEVCAVTPDWNRALRIMDQAEII